jgi:hypothetical protein
MDEPRLKAKLRVQAMLRQAQVRGCFGAVLRPGDADAGGILAVLRARAGLCVLSEVRIDANVRAWRRGTGATAVDQEAADAYIARQLGYDPDLWVIEVETDSFDLPFEGQIAPEGR